MHKKHPQLFLMVFEDTLHISVFSCLGKLLLLISALTINRSNQWSLTDCYYDYCNYFSVSRFPVLTIRLIGMQQNTQPSDFFCKASFFLHSNYFKTVWVEPTHPFFPNKNTLIKEMNTIPVRLSETMAMTQQTSCFFKWKQIASTPLPLTYNDRKRLTRSALESNVGCWVTVLFNNTVQRTHPFLVQSYDKHVQRSVETRINLS